MNDVKEKVENFVIEASAESAIIINSAGGVIFSTNILYEDSVAAMGDAILSMCDMFLKDLDKGLLKQIYLKTNTNIIVLNRIDESNAILVITGSGTNLGLFLHNVEELVGKL